jgi:hypothetical protein
MPRYAPNKMPAAVKRRYFELSRTGKDSELWPVPFRGSGGSQVAWIWAGLATVRRSAASRL